MKRVLELFAGTGSVSKYCRQFPEEYHVTSLDIVSGADITCDILEWDYKALPKGIFDVIWASPPCTEFSTMLVRRARNLDLADSIVLKTLEIINYFEPKYYFIENPRSGLLKTRWYMHSMPFVDVSYCKYGYPYQKHTRIWTNSTVERPLVCHMDCDNLRDGVHIARVATTRSLDMKHSIPQELIRTLFGSMV